MCSRAGGATPGEVASTFQRLGLAGVVITEITHATSATGMVLITVNKGHAC